MLFTADIVHYVLLQLDVGTLDSTSYRVPVLEHRAQHLSAVRQNFNFNSQISISRF
jgi:hypothetical protein